MAGQYSASTLDVNVNYSGEVFNAQINNIAWNGDNFTGNIDGISISGVDNNGSITASGYYMGNKYTANGTVTNWN